MENKTNMNFVELPSEMVQYILSYVSFDEIAKLRSVNKFFNTVCTYRLNQGFFQVEKLHSKCMKAVKDKLPRRESERKHHPLSRHSDIMLAVESRLSMLSMTFTKFIDCKQCCFFPGKVLDEALRLLTIVYTSCILQTDPVIANLPILPRPHEFLQEFRDLSSMAMEYFDEKLLPDIRERVKDGYLVINEYKLRFIMVKMHRDDLGIEPLEFLLRNARLRKCRAFSDNSVSIVKIAKAVKRNQVQCNVSKKVLELLNFRVNALSRSLSSHVKASETTGAGTNQIYTPRLWFYELMTFLEEKEIVREGVDTLEENENESLEDDVAFLIQQQKNCIDNLNKSLMRTKKMLANKNCCAKRHSTFKGKPRPKKQKTEALATCVTSSITIPGNEKPSESQGSSSISTLVGSQQSSFVLNQDATPSVALNQGTLPPLVLTPPAVALKQFIMPTILLNRVTKPSFVLNQDTTPTVELNQDTKPSFVLNQDTKPTIVLNQDTTPTVELNQDTTPTAVLNQDNTSTFVLNLDTDSPEPMNIDEDGPAIWNSKTAVESQKQINELLNCMRPKPDI